MLLIRIVTVIFSWNSHKIRSNFTSDNFASQRTNKLCNETSNFQNVKITNVQLQIATAHFKQCHIDSISADT